MKWEFEDFCGPMWSYENGVDVVFAYVHGFINPEGIPYYFAFLIGDRTRSETFDSLSEVKSWVEVRCNQGCNDGDNS